MFYKRPSLRRGGIPEEPTGIEQLTPRKNFQFGTPGFNFLEPGLQRELRSSYLNQPNQFRFTQAPGIKNPFLKGGMMAAPFAGVGALAYLNRPKTTEALKVMKSEPSSTFDETGAFDFEDYSKRLREADKKGEEISFLDALFMDPETKTYPSIFGRTEDRDKKLALEKEKQKELEAEDDFKVSGKATSVRPGETALDAVLREGKVLAEKRAKTDKPGDDGDVDTSNDTKPGGQTVEDSFESTYDKQMKRLEKYLGTDNRESKGKLALALSDAIGTPGSIADKAAVLNKSLLNIAAGRKKDKREMAKLAFAAATELEKAQIAAGKKGYSERRFEEYANLASKANRSSAEEKRFQILKDGLGIKTGMTGQTAKAASTIADDIRKDILNLSEAGETEKASIQADIIGKINSLLLLQGVTKDNISGIVGYDISPYLGVKKADGGRIEMAVGGATETPAEPVATDLTFEQLRTRLPKEITDDIVKLVATSEEALQDFAYIRTQGDVEKFNVKYGVNLVLPQETA